MISWRRGQGGVAVGTLAVTLTFVFPAEASDFSWQPAHKHSTLSAYDSDDIRDTEFAKIIKDLLIDADGNSTVKDAKFFFQTCFGGGMLDDLALILGNTVKWVGGSASRYDELSWGEADVVAGAGDYWTLSLVPELKQDQTVYEAMGKAASNNPLKHKETGQRIHGIASGSQEIKLLDSATKSFHAILWAGIPDGDRHFNDILRMQAMLVQQVLPHVGLERFSVITLFGNGYTDKHGNNLPFLNPAGATRENLVAAVNSLKSVLGPDEQFFFYASDHGGFIQEPIQPGQPVTVPTGTTHQVKIELTDSEKSVLGQNPLATPSLFVDFFFLDLLPGDLAAATVRLCKPEDHDFVPLVLGLLEDTGKVVRDADIGTSPIIPPPGPGIVHPGPPSSVKKTFFFNPLPEDWNDLTFCLENNSGKSLVINNFYFYSGPIGESTLIPEPATFSFLLLGGLRLVLRRRVAA